MPRSAAPRQLQPPGRGAKREHDPERDACFGCDEVGHESVEAKEEQHTRSRDPAAGPGGLRITFCAPVLLPVGHDLAPNGVQNNVEQLIRLNSLTHHEDESREDR